MTKQGSNLRRGVAAFCSLGLGVLQITVASPSASAAAASPTRVTIVNSELRVLASAGRSSAFNIDVLPITRKVRIGSPSATGEFEAVMPCEVMSSFSVECPLDTIARLHVDAGDGNDSVSSILDVPTAVAMGSGNDLYSSDGVTAQTVDLGAGDDQVIPSASGADNVFGGPGADVVSYRGSAPVIVRLDNVANDGSVGENDNIHSDVEDIIGSSANDVLIGSNADNRFIGGLGNDKLDGGGGNDTFREVQAGNGDDNLRGGSGSDTVDYSEQTSENVTVSLDNAANDGSKETDNVHSDVENVLTGSGDDTLIGSAAGNILRAGGGHDIVSGGGGNDLLDGGEDKGAGSQRSDWLSGGSGVDAVTYSTRRASITVRLDSLENDGVAGERDKVLSDVENVLGGSANDTLVGSSAGNILRGLGGNDILNGQGGNDSLEGGTGRDVLFGSGGVDAATYLTHPVGVAVTLDNGANDGRANEADNVHSDIENVTGSNHNDTIVGSSTVNVLRGAAGSDRLFGRAGDDSLIGDSGSDQGFGDQGRDTCTTERRTSCS